MPVSVNGERGGHCEQKTKRLSNKIKHIHKASRGNDQNNHQRTVKSTSSFFSSLPEIGWHYWNLALVLSKTADLGLDNKNIMAVSSSKERCHCPGEEFNMPRKEMELMGVM